MSSFNSSSSLGGQALFGALVAVSITNPPVGVALSIGAMSMSWSTPYHSGVFLWPASLRGLGLSPARTTAGETAAVGEYLATKAPKQVTPGTRVLEGRYINDLGRVEPWSAHYDAFGRLIGRTDFNAGNAAQGIPMTHYHVYDWLNPGAAAEEIMSHVPGVFAP